MKKLSFKYSKLVSSGSLMMAAASAILPFLPMGTVVAQEPGFDQSLPPPPALDDDMGSGDFAPPPFEDDGFVEDTPGFEPPPPPSTPSRPGATPPRGGVTTSPRPNPAPPSRSVPSGQELVSIDFPEPTEIRDIIKAVGQWTGKNFILRPGTSAKVSIISPQMLTKEEAYQAFLSALNVAGFTTVDSGKVVKIVQTNRATGANIKTFYSSTWAPRTDEVITQIIPLKYIDSNTVSQQLRSIITDTRIIPFATTNSLIVSDTGNKVARIIEIVSFLDVKDNQPQVSIEQLRYNDAKDVRNKVQEIFAGGGGRGGSLFLQRSLVDERTNSIILIGPPRGLNDVVRFIRRLDKPVEDANSQAQIHVRPLDYADAEKLAATLQALAAGGTNRPGAPRVPTPPRPIPGAQPGAPGGPGGANGAAGGAVAVAELGGVKITADKATNALIIQGSRGAYRELDTIIQQLDKRRDQVYVEADILDINIGTGSSFRTSLLMGAQAMNGNATIPMGWQAGRMLGTAIQIPGVQANPSNLGADAVLGVLGNKAIELAGGITLSPAAFIFALKNDSNNNVLQSPSMLVADNETATFDATDERIVYTSRTNPQTGQITDGAPERLPAGLNLKIKPQISRAGYVNMDITLKADNFGQTDAQGRPTQKFNRGTETKVTTRNEQTIVISGLQRDVDGGTKAKVPLLGEIPIIGWFFRDTTADKTKTSLTVFLTPYIIRSSEDLARIYDKKVQARDEFLRTFYGSNYQKKEIFKRLPTPEMGRARPDDVPPPVAQQIQPPPGAGQQQQQPQQNTESGLPSEDPNPIVVPGSGGGGGGGGFGGGGGGFGGDFAPPPPPGGMEGGIPPPPMDPQDFPPPP